MTISVPGQLTFSSQGDGVTTVFSYPVKFWENSEIVVVRREDDVDTTLVLSTHYTVSGAGVDGGGSITMLVAPTADQEIIRYRDTAAKQVVDLEDSERNPAVAVEEQLDRLAMVSQDHAERFSRTVMVGPGETPPTLEQINDAYEYATAAQEAATAAEAAQEAAEDARDDAEGYRDDAIAAVAAVQPTTRHPFEVVLAQTSVTIPGGYTVGTVSSVYLNGLLLKASAYAATTGTTVTFSAITADDILDGETTATIEVLVGTSIAGFSALDSRFNREFSEVVTGLVYDGTSGTPTDNRATIQAALDTGRTVIIPDDPSGNGGWVGYLGCLYQTTPDQVVHDFSRKISLDPSPGGNGQVFPMWIQTQDAIGAKWIGGVFDHRGMDWVSATTGAGAANVGFATALLMMADRGEIHSPHIFNGFDNGLGFMAANLTTGAQTPGAPAYAKAIGGYSENCGVGIHTHDVGIGPHQVGAGVNLLSGSRIEVIGWHDKLSRQNFIADYAGGASGQFVACIGDFAQVSSVGTQSFEGETIPIGGFGIYSGATHVKWIGVQINDAAQWGAWFDGFSANNDIDLTIKYCGRGGVLINGRGHRGIIRVHDAGHLSPGTYPGIRVRGGHVDGDSYAIQLISPHVEGAHAAYGLDIQAGGAAQKAYGGSDGGMLQGSLAPVNNAQTGNFSVVNYRDLSTPRYVRDSYDYQNCANDAAAAAVGVPVGGKYRNGSVIMMRIA